MGFQPGKRRLYAAKPKPSKKSLGAHEGHVPEARGRRGVGLDGHLGLEPRQELAADTVAGEVSPQVREGVELHVGADEQHRLALLPGDHDLVDGADAVDVRRAIRHHEVAGVDHPKVDVQARPEGFGAGRAGTGAPRTRRERPGVPMRRRGLALVAVAREPANVGLDPRVEDRDAHPGEKFADARAPAELLLVRAGRHEVHGPREIDARARQQLAGLHREAKLRRSFLTSAVLLQLSSLRPNM